MPPGWSDIEASRTIRWAQGPVMTDKPAPDGNFFARPGQAMFAGRPMMVVATGARTMVFNYYLRNPGAPIAPDDITDGFRQAGFTVTPARCASNPGQPAPKRWYRLASPQKRPAFFYVGPMASGGQGYTLFLDQMPPMTQAESAAYTDACSTRPGAAAPAGATRIANGQSGVVAVIEALLRPAGSAGAIPWSALSTLPAVSWNKLPPMKMSNPFGDGGTDNNPRLLEGRFKSPTTEMTAIATGDDRAATRFLLRDGGNMPRGAVFDGLIRDGYAITAIRCGKPYTEMSDNWFRISGGGKQPAIFYRAMYRDGGRTTETYGLRIDNLLPPIQPGQTVPPAGRCPG
jgi:hypothetical protein